MFVVSHWKQNTNSSNENATTDPESYDRPHDLFNNFLWQNPHSSLSESHEFY